MRLVLAFANDKGLWRQKANVALKDRAEKFLSIDDNFSLQISFCTEYMAILLFTFDEFNVFMEQQPAKY